VGLAAARPAAVETHHPSLSALTPGEGLIEIATRSPTSSIPTDNRSKSGGTGLAGPSMLARCSTRLSTPPRDVARANNCSLPATASAASRPPCTRIESMPPKPPDIWRFGHGVAGVVAEAGIEHLRHIGMAEAVFGDGLGAAAGLAHAQHQGAQAAQQEPALESRREWRRWPSAGGRCACQNASSRAAMRAPASTSLWPLRYLVAECMTMSAPCSNGAGQHGRGGGAVDAQHGAGAMGDVGGGGDVRDLPARVGRRLDPDHARLPGPHGRGKRHAGRSCPRGRRRPPQGCSSSSSQVRSAQYISLGATTWSPA